QLEAMRAALAGPQPSAVDAYDPEAGGEPSQGALTFVDSAVDTTTGAGVGQAEFANAHGTLWPGRYGRGEGPVGMAPDAAPRPSGGLRPVAPGQAGAQGGADGNARPAGAGGQGQRPGGAGANAAGAANAALNGNVTPAQPGGNRAPGGAGAGAPGGG